MISTHKWAPLGCGASENWREKKLAAAQAGRSKTLISQEKSTKTLSYLLACLLVCLIEGSLAHQHQHLAKPGGQANKAPQVAGAYRTSVGLPNITLTNRPIERPQLANDSNRYQRRMESPTDWLMMGGADGSPDDLVMDEGRQVPLFAELPGMSRNASTKRSGSRRKGSAGAKSGANRTVFDDEQSAESSDSNEIFDDAEEGATVAGTQKEPDCAAHGRYYCTYKEEYPIKLVTEVTKYYKWPLEKLFRDLHAQIMPKLAQDSTGNLVCDSITRVVRPGWARNTNDRWLVVINTENYHQYVTEVVCQYGSNSRCNFIPPCYYSSCQQRYNTQKLLVIDPSNPYRGPFLSEFLFPSCCVCYVPSASEPFQDKYRSSPATIYQRTMQQEAANNVYPPQFRPTGLLEELPNVQVMDHSSSASRTSAGATAPLGAAPPKGSPSETHQVPTQATNRAPAPGEIRRAGDQYKRIEASNARQARQDERFNEFPRLGLSDSLVHPDSDEVSVSSADSNKQQQR